MPLINMVIFGKEWNRENDIHGAYKALMQCFEWSKFNYKKDRPIVMSDVCDGYPDVKQCIDQLLKIKRGV